MDDVIVHKSILNITERLSIINYYSSEELSRAFGGSVVRSDVVYNYDTDLLRPLIDNNIFKDRSYKIVYGKYIHQDTPECKRIHTDFDDRTPDQRTFLFPLSAAGHASTVIFNEKSTTKKLKLESGFTIDDQVHEKYLGQYSCEELNGLSINTLYDWVVGDCLEFDSKFIHTPGYLPESDKKFFVLAVVFE